MDFTRQLLIATFQFKSSRICQISANSFNNFLIIRQVHPKKVTAYLLCVNTSPKTNIFNNCFSNNPQLNVCYIYVTECKHKFLEFALTPLYKRAGSPAKAIRIRRQSKGTNKMEAKILLILCLMVSEHV